MYTFSPQKIIAITTLVRCYSDNHYPYRGNNFIVVATHSTVCLYSDRKDMKHGLFKNSNYVTIATLPHGYSNISIVAIETLACHYSV